MKVFLFLFLIVSPAIGKRLISTDVIEKLFKKLARNELTDYEESIISDIFEILSEREYVKSVEIRKFTTGIRSLISCLACLTAFAALFEAVRIGKTNEQIERIMTFLCVSFRVQDEKVCRGAIKLNLPILTYVIRNTPEASPTTFCSLLLQTEFSNHFCVLKDARFQWTVNLPPPFANRSKPVQTRTSHRSRPLKVALLTDAHIDFLYEPYGVANCNEPLCCRKGQRPSYSYRSDMIEDESILNQSILTADSKVMLDLDIAKKIKRERQALLGTRRVVIRNKEPAGYWGDYRYCDTPIWAFDDVIDTIAENHKDIDMIYYLGDSIDHGVWGTSHDSNSIINCYLIEKLKASFGNVKVVPVIGNHEVHPVNQFAPSYMMGEKLNTTWLYASLAEKWCYYLTDEAKESLRKRGDYSLLVLPGLKIISLNNNIAQRYNWWQVFDPFEAKKHLDWLVEELYKAELAGESVHILTHVPPGVEDLTYTWTREYNRIVNRFSSTIKAEFNGHSHTDEFKIFYNLTDGTPINVAWGAGGATTYDYFNLNYKIAIIERETYEPMNIVNYIYNLTEANLTPNQRPRWFQLYNFKQTFGLTDLSACSVDGLVQKMVAHDRHLLDMYVAFTSKMNEKRWLECDDSCKIDTLCHTVVTVLWSREKCDELKKIFYM